MRGRPKGTPNALSATVKAAILEAFEQAGGADYLRRIASSDPRTFCTLLSKVLPMRVTGDDSGPVVINIVKFAGRGNGAC